MIVTLGATYASTALVTSVSDQPRMVIRCVRGLDDSFEVRGTDTIIPTASGRVARNRVRDRRVIELAGHVLGTGDTEAEQRADVRAALEELRALFDPSAAPGTLVLDLEDGGTATIAARPVNMIVPDDPVPTWRQVSIELEAVGADWTIAPPAP